MCSDVSPENLIHQIEPGKDLFIIFTGFNDMLNDSSFEFATVLQDLDVSKIFVRNRQKVWYHSGISDQVNTIGKLITLLTDLISSAASKHVTFVGACAGGFAAILFGHFLKADFVHAIGPQTFLDEDQNRHHGVYGHPHGEGEGEAFWYPELQTLYGLNLPNEDCFYDLKKHISSWNGVTRYNIHISSMPEENEGARADHIYAEHLVMCEGVFIHRYPCSGHSCVAGYLKANNDLMLTLLDYDI